MCGLVLLTKLPWRRKLELVSPNDAPPVVLEAVHVYISEVIDSVGQISRKDTT